MLILLLGGVIGCASPVVRQYATLATRQSCCASFSELQFDALEPRKKTMFRFDPKAPVYALGDHKSYVAGVRLPDTTDQFLLVKSYFNGMFIGQFFDPIIVELDAGYEPIRTFSLNLRFDPGNLFGDMNAHMWGVFLPSPQARYLVLLTADPGTPAPVAKTAPSVSVYQAGNSIGTIYNGGATINLSRSPTGQVALQLKPRTKT